VQALPSALQRPWFPCRAKALRQVQHLVMFMYALPIHCRPCHTAELRLAASLPPWHQPCTRSSNIFEKGLDRHAGAFDKLNARTA
jgi:hypothetical protein